MSEIRTGEIRGIQRSSFVAVVVAHWADAEGEDVRIVPLSSAGARQWMTDRDVHLTPQDTDDGSERVAHVWLARTLSSDLLGASQGSISTDALRVIRDAELIGIDASATAKHSDWRGTPLASDVDPRLAWMQQQLRNWEDAEQTARLFRSHEWVAVMHQSVISQALLVDWDQAQVERIAEVLERPLSDVNELVSCEDNLAKAA
jgi:hypothetical protein